MTMRPQGWRHRRATVVGDRFKLSDNHQKEPVAMSKVPLAAAVVAGVAAVAVAGCGESKRPTPKLPPPMSEQRLIDAAAPGVVAVKARTERGISLGTGWIVDPERVMTAAHVVNGGENIKVRFKDGTVVPARIEGINPCSDRALLRLTQPAPNRTVLPMADGGLLGSNTPLTLLHYGDTAAKSFSREQMSTSPLTVANPQIRRPELGKEIPRLDNMIQVQGVVPAGASGGPTLDRNGRVTGMIVIKEMSASQGYALPIGPIRQALPALRAGDRQGWLGLDLIPVDRGILRALFGPGSGFSSPRLPAAVAYVMRKYDISGLLVMGVADDGPADGKLEPLVLVSKMNGVQIRSMTGVCGVLASTAPGDRITVSGYLFGQASASRPASIVAPWKVRITVPE
jgi:serine protease Do